MHFRRALYHLTFLKNDIYSHTITRMHLNLIKYVLLPFRPIVFQPLLGAVLLHSLCSNTHTCIKTLRLIVTQPLFGDALLHSLCWNASKLCALPTDRRPQVHCRNERTLAFMLTLCSVPANLALVPCECTRALYFFTHYQPAVRRCNETMNTHMH